MYNGIDRHNEDPKLFVGGPARAIHLASVESGSQLYYRCLF